MEIALIRTWLLSLALMASSIALAQAGSLDLTFNPNDLGNGYGDGPVIKVHGAPYKVLIQPDGKVLVAGSFDSVLGKYQPRLVRLNADGTADPTFDTGTGFGGYGNAVSHLAVRPDGRILTGGDFYSFDSTPASYLLQLNADGSLDSTFSSWSSASNSVRQIVLQSDGKVIIVGPSYYNGTDVSGRPFRLNIDASLDTTYHAPFFQGGGPYGMLLQTDGELLVWGSFSGVGGEPRINLARLMPDGSLDLTYNPIASCDGTGFARGALQSNGKLILSGDFTLVNGYPLNGMLRIDASGALDTSFDQSAGISGAYYPALNDMSIDAADRIVLSGRFDTLNGAAQRSIGRLNADGSRDTSFVQLAHIDQQVFSTAVDNAGGILAVGNFNNIGEHARGGCARFLDNGRMDPTFAPSTGVNDEVSAIELMSDGSMIIGGTFCGIEGATRHCIGRLAQDGTLDTAYAAHDGFRSAGGAWNGAVRALLGTDDGGVLVGGSYSLFDSLQVISLCKLNSFGTVDTSFDAGLVGGTVNALAMQSDGKILVGGKSSAGFVARLHPDGSQDTTFSPVGMNWIWDDVASLAVQPDGKILVGGRFPNISGQQRHSIARLNTDGSVDVTFDAGTLFMNSQSVTALSVQPDGKILVGQNYGPMMRLNTDGSLDTTFLLAPGVYSSTVLPCVRAFHIQPDGKIIAAGWFEAWNGTPLRSIVRLNADGSVDPTFDPGSGFGHYGPDPQYHVVTDLTVQPDGLLIAVGSFTSYDGIGRNRIARINLDFITGTANEHARDKSMIAFPNPSNGVVSLHLPDADPAELTVSDATGTLVHREVLQGWAGTQPTLSLSHLANGAYHIQAATGSDVFHTEVIIVH